MRRKVVWLAVTWGAILSSTAPAVQVEIQNSIVAGSKWSFDLGITNPGGVSAQAFQATLQVTGPGSLALDVAGSQAVASEAGYWVLGNSQGANAIDKGAGKYQFGDGPNNGIAELLQTGDKMARFTFDWTVVGQYTINVDTSILNTFITDGNFTNQTVSIANNGFYVPEPTTILLLALALPVLRRRSRRT